MENTPINTTIELACEPGSSAFILHKPITDIRYVYSNVRLTDAKILNKRTLSKNTAITLHLLCVTSEKTDSFFLYSGDIDSLNEITDIVNIMFSTEERVLRLELLVSTNVKFSIKCRLSGMTE